MRDLVVCCDGTWQDVASHSNVSRLHDLLDDPVVRCYVKGVGTGDLLDRLRGGLTGFGLARALVESYRFLVDEYVPGDRISVFGFSRGAYTVRSLAGMVGRVGIVDRTGLDGDAVARAVDQAYARYRGQAAGGGPAAAGDAASPPLAYDPRSPDIPVALVGVWDTVGALGIPRTVGLPDLLGSREYYEFLDVVLDPRIPFGRHAVSLDEMGGSFRPTLWAEAAATANQNIKQVWFPGDHCDVGGGHVDTRLSDGALKWMVDEAAATVGLPFRESDRTAIASDPVADALHGQWRGLSGAVKEASLYPCPRATPLVDCNRPSERIAESAYAIQRSTRELAPDRRYRASRTLEPGEAAQIEVAATRAWNPAGLYLEPGRYGFVAVGQWCTSVWRCGPRGLAQWPVAGGALADFAERALRRILHNPEAELLGARREPDRPLMVLVGVVANEVTDVRGRVAVRTGTLLADEKLIVGEGLDADIERPGYLWFFANDAWGGYGNNDGRVLVTVTRYHAPLPVLPTSGLGR